MVEVVSLPELGRCLVATRSYVVGELILEEEPLLHWSRALCDTQLGRLLRQQFPEPTCDVWLSFEDLHCKADASLNATSPPAEAGDMRILPHLPQQQTHQGDPSSFALDVLDASEQNERAPLANDVIAELVALHANRHNHRMRAAIRDMFVPTVKTESLSRSQKLALHVKQHIPAFEESDLEPDEIHHFMTSVVINAHCTDDGIGFYSLGSKVSHSCSPNADFRTQPRQTHDGSMRIMLQHRAIRNINRGDLITVYYFSLQGSRAVWPTHLRRKFFRLAKYFWCRCQRCSGPDDSRRMRCIQCRESCSVRRDADDDSRPGLWRCETCGFVAADAQMPLEIEAALETQIWRLEKEIRATEFRAAPLLAKVMQLCSVTSQALGDQHWIFAYGMMLSSTLLGKSSADACSDAESQTCKSLLISTASVYYDWLKIHIFPHMPMMIARDGPMYAYFLCCRRRFDEADAFLRGNADYFADGMGVHFPSLEKSRQFVQGRICPG